MAEPRGKDRWIPWAFSNLTVLAAIIVAALTTVRLTQVAAGNRTTSLAILQHAGTGNIVLAVVVDALPYLAPYAIAGFFGAWHAKTVWYWSALLLVLLPTLRISPLPTIFLGGFFLFGFRHYSLTYTPLISICATVAITLLSYGRTMWLPAEGVRVGANVEVGYVLKDSTDKLILLRDADRRIVMLPPTDIRNRHICEIRAEPVIKTSGRYRALFERPAWDLFGTTASYPRCPPARR